MLHTKEPWLVADLSKTKPIAIFDKEGRDVIANLSRGLVISNDKQLANAARIVACVNACDGIETSLLESIHAKNLKLQTVGKVEETQAFMADIASKLDDLLTASKRYADKYCVDEADDAETCTLEQHEDAKALFRAIAKAEA